MNPNPFEQAVDSVMVGKRIKRIRKSIPPTEPAARPVSEPTLEAKLIACFKKSNFHDPEQDYAPLQEVKQLITLSVVQKEIHNYEQSRVILTDTNQQAKYEEIDDDFKVQLAHWIPRYGYRTFATAVVSGFSSLDLIHFMAECAEDELTDEDLPLLRAEEIVQKCVPEAAKVRNFCSQRWSFLAPIFSPEHYDYNLSNNCIFPFEKDAMKSRTGAFGSVSKVRVHGDHQEHKDMEHVRSYTSRSGREVETDSVLGCDQRDSVD